MGLGFFLYILDFTAFKLETILWNFYLHKINPGLNLFQRVWNKFAALPVDPILGGNNKNTYNERVNAFNQDQQAPV